MNEIDKLRWVQPHSANATVGGVGTAFIDGRVRNIRTVRVIHAGAVWPARRAYVEVEEVDGE